jgi:NAD(P)-dependent dehydrogenase (short-subunit alcohol dehydrogenase family)
MRLEGKVALISGSARGMGAAEARLFAREGAGVVIGDVRDHDGRQVAAEIIEIGGEALFVRLDVTREEDWRSAVGDTVQRFGKLNVLVNNAGIYSNVPIEHASVEEWDEIMAVNARGVFLGTKHVIPAMREAGGGAIVNLSSTVGIVGSRSGSAYGPSKGAVRLLTKYTALQHAKDQIRANSIHPGPTDTDMIGHLLSEPEVRARVVESMPLGRLGTAEDIAYGALFLASDESSFMTGSELVMDGGVTAQ